MGAHRRPQRGDYGETLIELLVAITILGIAGVAILAGMAFSVQASTVNRNQAGGAAYLRSAAEAIQKVVDGSGYPTCGNAVTTYTPAANSVISPSDISKGYVIQVLGQPESWVRVGAAPAPQWSSCAANGVQRVKLQLTTPGDSTHGSVETMYVVLRQPCDGTGGDPCL